MGGFVAAAALVWRRLLLVEVAYFWGLGGTLQAVLTPDLQEHHFPSFPYLQFYVTHDLTILAALFLVIGLGLRPRPGAVPRIYLLTLGFAVVIGLIDLVTGGNYMYLRVRAPGSLLEVMGPWPWYIATGAVLTLIVLVILDAPFRLSNRLGTRIRPSDSVPPSHRWVSTTVLWAASPRSRRCPHRPARG